MGLTTVCDMFFLLAALQFSHKQSVGTLLTPPTVNTILHKNMTTKQLNTQIGLQQHFTFCIQFYQVVYPPLFLAYFHIFKIGAIGLCILLIFARQRLSKYVPAATNTYETIEELLGVSFSIRSGLYQRKVDY
jgi:hypothetical protein